DRHASHQPKQVGRLIEDGLHHGRKLPRMENGRPGKEEGLGAGQPLCFKTTRWRSPITGSLHIDS
ncbi:MAG: hypothetical protein SNJ81_12710, partial [Cyanobacteriota bacterium]